MIEETPRVDRICARGSGFDRSEQRMSAEDLSLYAVGDVRPDWPNPDSIVEMELVLPIFKQADILFGNLESPISDKGERQVCNSGRKIRPEKISLLTDAGFDVMSFAN